MMANRNIFLPLLVACCLLLASVLIFSYFAAQLIATEKEQEKIGVILLAARDVLSGLTDAETAQRGYLISGNEAFLEPFHSGKSAADKNIEKLRLLLAGNSRLSIQIDKLQELAEKKFAFLDKTISLRREGDVERPQRMVSSGIGKTYMDDIRGVLGALLKEERERRSVLNKEISDAVFFLLAGFVSMVVVVISTLVTGYRTTIRTLNERNALADTLAHEATHDLLTKLPNRRYFFDFLNRSLALAKRAESRLSVLFIDLDGFKVVNDECGHQCGDEVLRNVARIYSEVMRESDLLARLGGDEFALIAFPSSNNPDELSIMAKRYVAALAEPMELNGKKYKIGASIGVASYPTDAEDADALVAAADQAMYQAKKCGKNRVCHVAKLSECGTCPVKIVCHP